MKKNQNKKMINILEELGIKKTKRTKDYKILAGVLAVLCFVIFVISAVMWVKPETPKYTKEDFPGCFTVINARYVSSYRKDYRYEILVAEELQTVNKTYYCYQFHVENEPKESLQVDTEGNILIEVDELLDMEIGKTYTLPVYKGGKYLADFYPIDSGLDSVKRDSVYFLMVDSLAGSLDYLIKKH